MINIDLVLCWNLLQLHIIYQYLLSFHLWFVNALESSKIEIQWNLSIADTLHSGHLSIADTSFRNQLSSVMVKPLDIEPHYSGHLSIADTFLRTNGVRYWEVSMCIKIKRSLIPTLRREAAILKFAPIHDSWNKHTITVFSST